MAVDRGGVVLAAALLDAETARKESVAAGRVSHEPRPPDALLPGLHAGAHRGAVGIELDAGHPALLDRARSLLRRVAKQDLVELRAPHLVGGGKGIAHGV